MNDTNTPVTYNVTTSDMPSDHYYQQPIPNISPDQNHHSHQQYNNNQESTSNNYQKSTSDNVSSPKFQPNTIFQSNSICYQNIVFSNNAINNSVLMQFCSCSSLTNNSQNSQARSQQ
ncbi:unnamed protein product [Rhizophagus irregularis]|uniref:Uncharacterized protein n=1 Tax=Rhizophagus irregularis TaxID=588596 RepID=A0A2N1MTS8_9GLOM|nr:hypothetical protein RhiirC2_853888 [Rhizophagus irregularis]CAB4391346.1 unnamed protein product [Rhizophagus irregularis]CAB5378419.1 unnamed protein product [Rhizophagus irregularis]